MFEANHNEANLTNEQKILREVVRGNIDFAQVGKDLAVYYPDLFLVVLGTNNDHKIRQLLESGQRVAAIKLRREVSDEGLKEAKDYCDKMVPPTPTPQINGAGATFNGAYYATYGDLLSANILPSNSLLNDGVNV